MRKRGYKIGVKVRSGMKRLREKRDKRRGWQNRRRG